MYFCEYCEVLKTPILKNICEQVLLIFVILYHFSFSMVSQHLSKQFFQTHL